MNPIIIGSWLFPQYPESWLFVSGEGFRSETTAASISAVDEAFEEGEQLAAYIKKQLAVLDYHLPHAKVVNVHEVDFPETNEAQEVTFEVTIGAREIIISQLYVERHNRVGVVTFATAREESTEAEEVYRAVRGTIRFNPDITS